VTKYPGIGGQMNYRKNPNRKVTVKDYKHYRWRSGKHYIRYLYEDLLDRLIEDMLYNLANEYDNLVLVTGEVGSGKSNAAYAICKKFDPNFSMEDGYVYDAEQFFKNIQENNAKGRVFWMDEGVNVANNRAFMTLNSRNFIELLNTMRSLGWTMVMCVPNEESIDIHVRLHRVSFKVDCQSLSWSNNHEKKRGYFELSIPLRVKGSFVRYDSCGYGQFPKMDAETKMKYEEIKLKNQKERISNIGKNNKDKLNETQERFRVAVFIMKQEGFSIPDIIDRFVSCGVVLDYNVVANMISRTRKELCADG
jgi:Zonular occludens toxin (Zot).